MRVNRARLGLALLMLPTFLVALDTTALLLALPRLSAALGADSVDQLWMAAPLWSSSRGWPSWS